CKVSYKKWPCVDVIRRMNFARKRQATSSRTPVSGRVVKINARAGEQIGGAGIAEGAKTDRRYAVAEVYETDIGRAKAGQQATIACDALPDKLTGKLEVMYAG